MFKFPAKLPAEKSQGEWKSHGLALAELVILALSWFALALRWFLTLTVATGCLYQVVASPPLHLMGFPVKPAAGESSIYVPGSGFSGVWFHLGFLQALPSVHDHDFYCYSSGCLSVLMAFMNTTLQDATDAAHSIQTSWMAGHLSRYDLVDRFIDNLLVDGVSIEHLLDRLHVLVTTTKNGVAVEKAADATQLKELLLKTTFIPFITGRGLGYADADDRFLDGGFSRMLHPKCNIELWIPLTLWDITQHTLNPALDRDKVEGFWLTGQRYREVIVNENDASFNRWSFGR
mmetsp:Transcript_931/g.1742  ORF Transcript_931/g.1742 Transcript_931/m.1742 type:complete len:289 (+) Transcript_931:92-958(+)